MRVITLNANGIRSAIRKGFFEWVEGYDPDVICIQETKIKSQECPSLEDISLPGYHVVYEDAQKRGYSGVAIFSKQKPLQIANRLGMPESDAEGRFLQFDFQNFSVVSIYMPSGTSGEGRQEIKMAFLDHFYTYLEQQIQTGKRLIICGDWNIAHQTIDLKNWKSNQKNSGFLPEERAWLDQVFGQLGYIDAFRVLNQSEEQYTWWSMRSQARTKNVGWRIDYQVVTPNLKEHIKHVEIVPQPFFSDHAPVIIDYQGLEHV
jgi:exodeoxyribonuclease-3